MHFASTPPEYERFDAYGGFKLGAAYAPATQGGASGQLSIRAFEVKDGLIRSVFYVTVRAPHSALLGLSPDEAEGALMEEALAEVKRRIDRYDFDSHEEYVLGFRR